MNDFVKINKPLNGEKPNFSACDFQGFSYRGEKYSVSTYHLTINHSPITIKLNESTGILTVEGNLAYFLKPHNLKLSYKEMRHAIELISDIININVFHGEVKEFDHSAIVKTVIPAKIIFENHFSIPGHLLKPQRNGKYFLLEGTQLIKIYDAGKRLKQKTTLAIREGIYKDLKIESTDNLIRFEKKFFNASRYFKGSLTVEDIMHPDFINQCNQDLMSTYKTITKAGNFELPKNKKHINAGTIPLLVGKELEAQYHFNLEDLIKQLINAIDNSILSTDDKKARRKQIKTNLAKISRKAVNEYDLSAELAASLKIDLGTAHE